VRKKSKGRKPTSPRRALEEGLAGRILLGVSQIEVVVCDQQVLPTQKTKRQAREDRRGQTASKESAQAWEKKAKKYTRKGRE